MESAGAGSADADADAEVVGWSLFSAAEASTMEVYKEGWSFGGSFTGNC